jgi:hypothetical protein
MKELIEQCQKCALLEREMNNLRRDVDEMKIDIKVSQKTNQDLEIKFGKLETLFTEKFIQLNDKLDDISKRMSDETDGRRNQKMTFIGQFLYPAIVGLVLFYIAYKVNGR